MINTLLSTNTIDGWNSLWLTLQILICSTIHVYHIFSGTCWSKHAELDLVHVAFFDIKLATWFRV